MAIQLERKQNKFARFFLDLLFPSFCVGCDKEGSFLCEECRKQIVVRRVPRFSNNISPISRIYAATEYSNKLVSELINRLKFHSVSDAHYPLTEILIEHILLSKFKKEKKHIIAAVPLHRKRQIKRGFNQSDLVAKQVADFFQIPCQNNILKRTKNTDPQTQMAEQSMRKENVKEIFKCMRPQLVSGKKVILVDDVITTGSTLSECALALKSAGAKSVIAFVVAH